VLNSQTDRYGSNGSFGDDRPTNAKRTHPGDEAVDAAGEHGKARLPPEGAGPGANRDPTTGPERTKTGRTRHRPDHNGKTGLHSAGHREPGAGGRTGDKGNDPGGTRNQRPRTREKSRDEIPAGGTSRSRTRHHAATETDEAGQPGDTGGRGRTRLPRQEDHRTGAGRTTPADQGTKGEQIRAHRTARTHETATGKKGSDNRVHPAGPDRRKTTRTDDGDV